MMGPFELTYFFVRTSYSRFEDEGIPTTVGSSPYGQRITADPLRPHPHNRAGHVYSLRPDLTRPGLPVLLAPAAIPAGVVLTSAVGAEIIVNAYENQVIERHSEHEKSTFWRSFSAALSGGFSLGNNSLF